MEKILRSTGLSVINLFQLQMIILLVVPFFIASFIWITLTLIFYAQLVDLVSQFASRLPYVHDSAQWAIEWIPFIRPFTNAFAILLLIVFIFILIVFTALLISSAFTMPRIVKHVSATYYPLLQSKSNGHLLKGIQNVIKWTLIYTGLWIITIPLWLIPGIGLAIPLVLNALLNAFVFSFDALSEHATLEEIKTLVNQHKYQFFTLGLIVSATMYIPLFLVIFPIFSGLCFSIYSLGLLQEYRAKKVHA